MEALPLCAHSGRVFSRTAPPPFLAIAVKVPSSSGRLWARRAEAVREAMGAVCPIHSLNGRSLGFPLETPRSLQGRKGMTPPTPGRAGPVRASLWPHCRFQLGTTNSTQKESSPAPFMEKSSLSFSLEGELTGGLLA